MKKFICGLLCAVFITGCAASSSTAALQTKTNSSSESATSYESETSNYPEVKEAITRIDDRGETVSPTLGITLWEYLALVDEKLHDLNTKKLSEYPHAIYPNFYLKTADIVFYLSNDIDIMISIDQTNNQIVQITAHSWSGAASFRASKTLGQIIGYTTMKAFEPNKGEQLINELHLYDANLKKGEHYEVKGDNYIYHSEYNDDRLLFAIFTE